MADPTALAEVVPDALCLEFMKARRMDRIQGFQYGDALVIRDVWLEPDKQEIWRGPADPREEGQKFSSGPLHDAFQERCELEKLRRVLASALTAAGLAIVRKDGSSNA